MPLTISSSQSTAIRLTSADDPVTITASGTIDATTGTYALYGPNDLGIIMHVTNSGLVRDTHSIYGSARQFLLLQELFDPKEKNPESE